MPRIRINGVEQDIDADPNMPLLWAIRDIVRLTGTKFGCGIGACGACTVHLDGQAVRSCLTSLADAKAHEIVTIEGLSADGSHPQYGAFGNYGVNQLLPQRAGDYPIDTGRLRGVVDLVAAQSNWGQKCRRATAAESPSIAAS